MRKLILSLCGTLFLCLISLIFLAQKPDPNKTTKPADLQGQSEHPSIYHPSKHLAQQYYRIQHPRRSPYHTPQNADRRFQRKNGNYNQDIYQETRNALLHSPFAPHMPESYPLPSPSKISSPNNTTGVEGAWVRSYESNGVPGNDIAVDVAIDAEDNIYVTGYTPNLPNGSDFYTIKYNPSGAEMWARYFDGEAHGDDIAVGVETDSSGNIYVGGYSAGNGTGSDFVVVKYNPAGQEEWIYRYDGSYQDNDQLTDMISDNAGNIHIAGNIPNGWATVKLNTDGSRLWDAQYSSGQYPKLALDKTGNVYTTCRSSNEFTTLKYNSEGVLQWEERYSRTANSYNEPAKIVVNDSGEVYVTGVSEIRPEYNRDITTVKYDRNGNQLWAVHYDSLNYDIASDLGFDLQGNVIVTGTSKNEANIDESITIKYNADGERIWAVRYGGDINRGVSATSSLVDSPGNIFVTGSIEDTGGRNWITLKYQPDGSLEWTSEYDPPGFYYDYPVALTMDSHNYLIITGYGLSSGTDNHYDYTTVKYNSDGAQQWESRFSGRNTTYGNAVDLALDGEGNIYVTGGHSDWGILTVKYDSKGGLQWASAFTEGSGSAFAIETDRYGNSYVLAWVHSDVPTNVDVLTIKYDSRGVQNWVARYDGPPTPYGDSYDEPVALSIDRWGNAYVLCRVYDEYGWTDFATLKYTADGKLEWVTRYGGGKDFSDIPRDLAVDDQGNVYVTGDRWGPQGSEYIDDFVVIKYNPRGEQQWLAHIEEGDYGQALAIGVDGWGNIFVNGKRGSSNALQTEVLITAKYNPSGEQQWIARYSEPQHIFGWNNKMKMDVFGNLCITGYIWDVEKNNQDYFTIQYDQNGAELWTARYDAAGSWDRADDLALDREGNVYVTGSTNQTGSGFDITTIKYNSAGQEKWIHRYAGNGNAWDQGNAIEVDETGNVYVAGYSDGSGWSYFKTLKISQTGSDSLGKLQVEQYELEQNFPNPFNNQTLIWYQLPAAGQVTFRIYNIRGQKVAEEDLGVQPQGRNAFHFRAENLASGIYFYQIQASDFVEARKMILVQ